MRALSDEKRTMIFFESPHRLVKLLEDMLEIFGDRQIAVANDITKMFEEIYRGLVSEAIQKYSQTTPKGEFTLVVRGKSDYDVQES